MADHCVDGLTWSDERLWPQFLRLAEADPQAVALVDCDNRSWTRNDLANLALEHAKQLSAAGVVAGSRVLVAASKTAGTCAAALAVSACQATLCPYSTKYTRADLNVLERRLGNVTRLVTTAEGQAILHAPDMTCSPVTDLEAVLIGFTSGSTGVPKGVRHGSGALNYATRACAKIAGLEPADSILGIAPLDSAPGFAFTAHFALSQGRPLVMIDPWDPVAAMRRAVEFQCAWAIMVPTHLFTMVEAARSGAWTGKLPFRAVAVGGSSMTAELIADCERLLGVRALRMFGMSECLGHCSTHPSDEMQRRQTSDGQPFPATDEEAFDSKGQPVPRGSRGEAGVRGPSLFLGYAPGMGEGQERCTPSGFLLTGDEIIRDEHGYVRVVGRIKDQIIRGGFNIDPAEVEAALLRHSAIAEVALVGIPEPKLGEQPCAVCRIRDGALAPDLASILQHLSELGVSRKKWPEHLVLVDSMTVGQTGKLDKKAMANMAAEVLGRS